MTDVLSGTEMRSEDLGVVPIQLEPTPTKTTWTRAANEPSAAGSEPRRSTATIRVVDVIRLIGSALAAVGLTSWL